MTLSKKQKQREFIASRPTFQKKIVKEVHKWKENGASLKLKQQKH